jgi:electron transfer flavoprotein alpha subunit
MSVLVVMESRAGAWNRMSFETLAAAQQFGAELSLPVHAVVFGGNLDEVADKKLDAIHTIQHELLTEYTPDGYSIALRQLIAKLNPKLVLFPHTYQVRDFAPKLATSLNRVLVSDVVAHRFEAGQIVFVRQLFQGKINADIVCTGEAPFFASLQAGAWRADAAIAGTSPVETSQVEEFVPEISADAIRSKPQAIFREAERAVDLSSAEIIVSVGRGIKEAENIEIVRKLAEALGAEMAASRPICDNGWMPMERQVGSSGQTVAPKVYIAVGISGAIQHLVGMKGAKTVVAINRDPEAPIFEIADYGIVGDLFQVVPALVEELNRVRG